MSTASAMQTLGLGGLPSGAGNAQNAIRAELIGIDLSAFEPGGKTAEAIVRSDPGGANATITFAKGGQTIPLPPELARALVGSAPGSTSVSVDKNGNGAAGSIDATIRRSQSSQGAAAVASTPNLSHSTTTPLGAQFSEASMILSQASKLELGAPSLWTNSVSTLMPQEAELALVGYDAPTPDYTGQSSSAASTGAPRETPGSDPASQKFQPSAISPQTSLAIDAFSKTLSAIVPGAGIGFERALGAMASMGPESASKAAESISRFGQASASAIAGASTLQNAPWVSQQTRAHELGEAQWSGLAWSGAPAMIAVGVPSSESASAYETREKLGVKKGQGTAWMRLRIEPRELGPIDIWAAILDGGLARVRIRAGTSAREALAAAKPSFSAALAAARVELSIDEEAARHE